MFRMQADDEHLRNFDMIILLQDIPLDLQLQPILHSSSIWQMIERRIKIAVHVVHFAGRQALDSLPIKQHKLAHHEVNHASQAFLARPNTPFRQATRGLVSLRNLRNKVISMLLPLMSPP